jgi:hypothetical protein
MTYTASGLPEGLSLDSQSGVLSGSVTAKGDYEIVWKATNAHGIAQGAMTLKIGETFALTPPMGWNSWNCWGLDLSQEKVFSSALALINSGLADYGYSYINIDDAWQAASRDEDGTLQPNENFPDVKAIGDWLHGRGLRLGIYSSPGNLTCGGYLGSLGYEEKDAQTWNDWGVDYLKYDLCGYRSILDTMSCVLPADHIRPYLKMQEYLREQPRDICYSLCQYGLAEVWKWGELVGANLWRTTGDITDTWESVTRIGFNLQRNLSSYAGPGHWNDPDMLEVGNGNLTQEENKSHFSLWCMMNAPLILGNDIRKFILPDGTVDKENAVYKILTNKDMIAINQDPLGIQCRRFKKGLIDVLVKPLADNSVAICVFNKTNKVNGTEIKLKDIANLGYVSLPKKDGYSVHDVWDNKYSEGTTMISAAPEAHGVKVYIVK